MLRIENYKRINSGVNFFLCSALSSMAKAAGEDEKKYDFNYFSAITGDMFAYMYNDKSPTDSGYSNSFFEPEDIKAAFAAFGRECVYLSNADIRADMKVAEDMIRASVENGFPVLARGMGNVKFLNGTVYDPMPEGCLIGGFDEDAMLVHLYPDADKIDKDEFGYTSVKNGLDTVFGLFFMGKAVKKTAPERVIYDSISKISVKNTKKPTVGWTYFRDSTGNVSTKNVPGEYRFGSDAFEKWASILENDANFKDLTDDKLAEKCWDLHCSAYCALCTSEAGRWLESAAKLPGVKLDERLISCFISIKELTKDIWALQNGFFPDMTSFRAHDFRAEIAEKLRKAGVKCSDAVNVLISGTAN